MKANGERIIVLPADDSDTFEWMSDGWNSDSEGTAGTPRAKKLMRLANGIIDKANERAEAIQLLTNAGFEVVEAPGIEEAIDGEV